MTNNVFQEGNDYIAAEICLTQDNFETFQADF